MADYTEALVKKLEARTGGQTYSNLAGNLFATEGVQVKSEKWYHKNPAEIISGALFHNSQLPDHMLDIEFWNTPSMSNAPSMKYIAEKLQNGFDATNMKDLQALAVLYKEAQTPEGRKKLEASGIYADSEVVNAQFNYSQPENVMAEYMQTDSPLNIMVKETLSLVAAGEESFTHLQSTALSQVYALVQQIEGKKSKRTVEEAKFHGEYTRTVNLIRSKEAYDESAFDSKVKVLAYVPTIEDTLVEQSGPREAKKADYTAALFNKELRADMVSQLRAEAGEKFDKKVKNFIGKLENVAIYLNEMSGPKAIPVGAGADYNQSMSGALDELVESLHAMKLTGSGAGSGGNAAKRSSSSGSGNGVNYSFRGLKEFSTYSLLMVLGIGFLVSSCAPTGIRLDSNAQAEVQEQSSDVPVPVEIPVAEDNTVEQPAEGKTPDYQTPDTVEDGGTLEEALQCAPYSAEATEAPSPVAIGTPGVGEYEQTPEGTPILDVNAFGIGDGVADITYTPEGGAFGPNVNAVYMVQVGADGMPLADTMPVQGSPLTEGGYGFDVAALNIDDPGNLQVGFFVKYNDNCAPDSGAIDVPTPSPNGGSPGHLSLVPTQNVAQVNPVATIEALVDYLPDEMAKVNDKGEGCVRVNGNLTGNEGKTIDFYITEEALKAAQELGEIDFGNAKRLEHSDEPGFVRYRKLTQWPAEAKLENGDPNACYVDPSEGGSTTPTQSDWSQSSDW
jgi:hypothetical protein